MTNLFCNVLVKFEKGAVEAEQGAIHELAWKKSHATQQVPQGECVIPGHFAHRRRARRTALSRRLGAGREL